VFDRWRDGTGSVFDLLMPDATWTIVGNSQAAGTFRSRQEFMQRVIEPFNARLASKLIPTVRAVYADGDMIIVFWDGVAHARDGKPYENTYTWYLELRDGRIVNAIAFFDSIAFNDLWTRVKPSD
jgi:ketosteroid isomerase-like protein